MGSGVWVTTLVYEYAGDTTDHKVSNQAQA